MSGADTAPVVNYDDQDETTRKRRALYIVFNTIVTVVVALALLEALIGPSAYGVDTATTSATQGDTTLEVRHPTVTRGQLGSPLEITATRQGGFAEPIVLTINADYIDLFRNQGPDPDPSSETATDANLILTFDPPPGDSFAVTWDLEAKPVGRFISKDAHIAVVDSAQNEIVAVDFETQVRP